MELAAEKASRYVAPILNMQHIAEGDHFAQFYEKDEFLIESLGAFIAKGFVEGEAAMVIATPEHRRALAHRLAAAGVDVAEFQKRCLYCAYDAATMLSRFMVNGHPDAKRFRALVGPIIETAAAFGSGVRAYGEMVALLWNDGNKQAALELEFLWNDLADHYSFILMCGYPILSFTDDEKSRELRHICRAHSCVLPHETYCDPLVKAA
jgi:hypothetical protein